MAGSPVVMRQGDDTRLDMWMTDVESRNVTHAWWVTVPDDEITDEGKEGKTGDLGYWKTVFNWDVITQLGTQAKSAPGIVCRDSDVRHDIPWYDNDKDLLWHSSYNGQDRLEPKSFEGQFIGDPSVFTFPDNKNGGTFWRARGSKALPSQLELSACEQRSVHAAYCPRGEHSQHSERYISG